MRFRGVPVVMVPVLVLGLLALIQPAGPADAIEPSSGIEVTVNSATPAAPQPDDVIRIKATVRNTLTVPVEDIAARLRVSPTPLVSRYEVRQVALSSSDRTGVYLSRTQTQTFDLAAGEQRRVTIRVDGDDLGLTLAGVYAVFVEVIGSVTAAPAGLDTVSFPLVWMPEDARVEPTGLVTATALTSGVDASPEDELLSDTLIRRIAPGGSLHRLVAGVDDGAVTGSVPVTWVMDPGLLSAVTDLARGRLTLAVPDEGPDSDLDVAALAADWLAAVEEATARVRASNYLTPDSQPDSSALLADGLGGLLRRGVESARADMKHGNAASLIEVPPEGSLRPKALERLARLDVPLVMLSDTFYPPAVELTYTPSGTGVVSTDRGDLTAVVPDSLLAWPIAGLAAGELDFFTARQLLLSDLALVSLERPSQSRTLVLWLDRGAVPEAGQLARMLTVVHRVPWVRGATLPQLLDLSEETPERRREPYPAVEAELPAQYLAPVHEINAGIGRVAGILVDPAEYRRDYNQATLRSVSSQWRDDLAAGTRLVNTIGALVSEQQGAVRSISSGPVTLAGHTGDIPLTIANDLDESVMVGVSLEGNPAGRLTAEDEGPVRIDPGQRRSLAVTVDVTGSAPLPVTVRIIDRDGDTFSESDKLSVRSTATSTIALGLMVIAGIALAMLVGWRFMKQRTGTGAEDADHEPS